MCTISSYRLTAESRHLAECKKVWISYNDPAYLKQRDHIQGCDEVPAKVPGALSKLTGVAAK